MTEQQHHRRTHALGFDARREIGGITWRGSRFHEEYWTWRVVGDWSQSCLIGGREDADLYVLDPKAGEIATVDLDRWLIVLDAGVLS